jgi:hypothetical protein
MKVMIVVLALAFGANASAFNMTSGATGVTIVLSVTSNDGKPLGQKEAIMKDAAEFYHSGKSHWHLHKRLKTFKLSLMFLIWKRLT